MSLSTPVKIKTLQRKLYTKAKQDPEFCFYVLYDKVSREDVLNHAYALVRSNGGAAGVDGRTIEQIEAQEGKEAFLATLGATLRDKTYQARKQMGSGLAMQHQRWFSSPMCRCKT